MRLETVDALLAPLLPQRSGVSAAVADWMRGFALARMAVLGLSICALPLILVAAPDTVPGLFGLFVALVVSSAAGLAGLRLLTPSGAVLLSTAGLAAVLAGPAPVIAAPALIAAGLTAALCDIAALPGEPGNRLWRWCAIAIAIAIIPGLAAAGLDRFSGWDEALVAAVPVLAVASIVTLILVTAATRARLAARVVDVAATVERCDSLLSAAGVAVVIVDRGGHVLDGSASAGALLCCKTDQLAGRGLIDRVLISDRPALLRAISAAVTAAGVDALTLRLCVSPVDASTVEPPVFASFRLGVAPFAGLTGTAAIRFAPAETETSAASAGHVDEDRLALLQLAGHEIRSPMNAILGFSEVLVAAAATPKRPEQVIEYARIIHSAAREAFATSSALLDLMRVEADGGGVTSEILDLAEIAEAAARQVNERAPVPVRVERAAADVLLETDAHACRTLFRAVLESFSTAFGGRSQVLCQVARAGLTPQILVTARDLASAASLPDGRTSGALAVTEALGRRLADRLGADLSFEISDSRLSARIEFPRAAATRPRPVSSSVLPLRMSA